MLNIDKKLQDIGKEIYLGLYLTNFIPLSTWDVISSTLYGFRMIHYGILEPYGFFLLPELNDDDYLTKFNEKYPDTSEEDVWYSNKIELNELFNKYEQRDNLLEVLNKY